MSCCARAHALHKCPRCQIAHAGPQREECYITHSGVYNVCTVTRAMNREKIVVGSARGLAAESYISMRQLSSSLSASLRSIFPRFIARYCMYCMYVRTHSYLYVAELCVREAPTSALTNNRRERYIEHVLYSALFLSPRVLVCASVCHATRSISAVKRF